MQNYFSKLTNLIFQDIILSGNRPPNISDKHVSCCVIIRKNISLQILFKYRMSAIVFGNTTKFSYYAPFWQCAQFLAPPTRNDIWTSKNAQTPGDFDVLISKYHKLTSSVCFFNISTSRSVSVLNFVTSKCASRHNGVHFFDISISKSSPELVCFVNFELEMCFAPQRTALFWHRNF